MNIKTLSTAMAISVLSMTSSAFADNRAIVQKFYDFLSNPTSSSHSESLKSSITENWKSVGDYSGKGKNRNAFIGQVGGFGKLIPDLKWAVEEMIEEDNRVVVRGRATGTPAGPLFGVDGQGKGFDIMTIDIHTLEGGKIVKTYHVEDWAGALRQLSAK